MEAELHLEGGKGVGQVGSEVVALALLNGDAPVAGVDNAPHLGGGAEVHGHPIGRVEGLKLCQRSTGVAHGEPRLGL